MDAGRVSPGVNFHDLAIEKMTSVLGESRARQLTAQILAEAGLQLDTADDLHAFSRELAKLPGFEGAVGAMLGVQAVLHGAARRAD